MGTLLFESHWLAGIAIRACLVLVLTACAATVLRHRSAAVVHAIWTAGLGGSLAALLVMALSPSWSLPMLPAPGSPVAAAPVSAPVDRSVPTNVSTPFHAGDNTRAISHKPVSTAASLSSSRPPEAIRATNEQDHTLSTAVDSHREWPSLTTVIVWVWVFGLLTLLVRLLLQTMAAQRRVRHAIHLHGTAWHDQRDRVARMLGLRHEVKLKRCSNALSPMVIGFIKPVVLLPNDAEGWSPERRHLVLLHELAHIQRHDVWTQLLATVACAVHWYNPFAWWGASQMKRLREIACDDVVVTFSSVPADYAQALLDVAKRYHCEPLTNAVAMARSSHVERRIAAILSSTRSRRSLKARSVRALAATAILLSAVVGTCQLTARAIGSAQDDTNQAPADSQSTESRNMRVHVLDEAGNALSDANIHVRIWDKPGKRDYPNRDYVTDEQGFVEVTMPRRLHMMRIFLSKPGFVPLRLNFGEGKHEEGRLIPDEYLFRLEKGHRLSGRVVDENGTPVSGATVQLMIEVNDPAWGVNPEPTINIWLTDANLRCPTPVTDSDGRWSIDNAPAPPQADKADYDFRLKVTHPEFAGDTLWGELQQQQGITAQALRRGDATLTLRTGIVVSGKITGPGGEPVKKGLVVWSDMPIVAERVNQTTLDDGGLFRTNRLAIGKCPITVLAPGYAPWQHTIDVKPDLGELEIKLEPGHPLRIKFSDQSGRPIPNVSVGIGEWRGTEAIFNQSRPNVPDSGIPRRANADGIYEWGWAPADAVNYQIFAEGFASHRVTLIAMPTPHEVVLAPKRIVAGTVTDATTGRPIESFLAMPVIVFSPDFYSTCTYDAIVGREGRYELSLGGSADPKDAYRVRFEAEGYRSVVSAESFGPLDGRVTLNMTLQPAPARRGRVVDAQGRPVAQATVIEASPTDVPMTDNGVPDGFDSRPIRTDAQGNFQLNATVEPVRVRVYHEVGFAEKAVTPNELEIGLMKLEPWAKVSGRLIQAGQPVAGQSIYFFPLVSHELTEARFQDRFTVPTDATGHFQFERIPPICGPLSAYLDLWRDSPLTSSESVPLELHPGEHRDVVLGGEGVTVNGRVVAVGRSNERLSKRWSINHLVSRAAGVDWPEDAAPLSFDPTGSLQLAWLRQPDFDSWMATRRNYFVKLSDDGLLQIQGVKPGEYDLVIKLYEEPAGCLVETIGEKVVPVTITAEHAAAGHAELGEIEVECRSGPRVGSDMRAIQFADASGRVRYVDDMRGRHVLLHAWATWCGPCVASMPVLRATVNRYSEYPLTVVGLNIDEDMAAAKSMVEAQGMTWAQNYLGPDPNLMRQLAVSSVPAYFLIGPDGKLLGSASEWEAMSQLLAAELK